jgi:hypothetical protein
LAVHRAPLLHMSCVVLGPRRSRTDVCALGTGLYESFKSTEGEHHVQDIEDFGPLIRALRRRLRGPAGTEVRG